MESLLTLTKVNPKIHIASSYIIISKHDSLFALSLWKLNSHFAMFFFLLKVRPARFLDELATK